MTANASFVSGAYGALRVGLFHTSGVRALDAWAREAAAWPVGSHVFGQYAELTESGPVVCRTENVSACLRGVAGLVDGPLRDVATDVLGVPASAFKDKFNYKQPGGAGFRPHQDVVAYPGVQRVVSILIALDECTTTSGCIWVASGVDEVLPTDTRGVVREDVASSFEWRPVEMAPGDALFLDGLTPHSSDTNRSDQPRRVLVASYAPADEGYTREQYYAARADQITNATQHDGRFRISTLADFAGVDVGSSTPTAARCTHG